MEKRARDKAYVAAIVLVVLTLLLMLVYFDHHTPLWKWITVFTGTLCYHVCIRVAIDFLLYYIPEERLYWREKFFKPRSFEQDLYRKVKVKRWEDKLPGYYSDRYNVETHSDEEILFVMCEDEVRHWLQAAATLLALILGPVFFGGFLFFFLTSLPVLVLELAYVASFRYDRPRYVRRYMQ